MIKLDKKFFQRVEVRAIRAEFGAAGVMTIVELMCEMFESPHGYWLPWRREHRMAFAGDHGLSLEDLDFIVRRMCEYGMVDKDHLNNCDVLTSAYLQREFIRQCGASRASRLYWDRFCMLSADELVELGVVPACDDPWQEIPEGEPLEISGLSESLSALYRKVRVRTADRSVAVFRRIKVTGKGRGRGGS